ncbi:Stearoyl-CoA desaturase 5 [Sarcoptes scabiei]|uniref:Stearoyl-CoA desaturase 5 n=2 Tax=Sarcoptes scabiei TaxID=52283 RepID=A0A834VFN3_SARSC|nr:Stearoyl-CoA desaturase 5 [Sarcoptes scabiei]
MTSDILIKHRKISANSFENQDNVANGDDSIASSENIPSLPAVKDSPEESFKITDIVWRNVILLTLLHMLAIKGWLIFMIDPEAKWQTSVATFIFGLFSSTFGITAGAHRLWSHRSYKAKWPLRLVLAFANTMALQNDIYEWSRDHRVHHKYSETNADPHNSRRGFFFAHMGWLMLKKHQDVKLKGKNIDMSDLWADPIVRFQRRFYIPLVLLCWGIIPTLIPYYLWNERLYYAFLGCVCFRYVYVLHCTWLVNSAAHLWGHRPYDRNIEPRENNSVVYLALGEGYHNYHHAFPFDYSASEYGFNLNFNLTTFLIDSFEKLGQAYDLKKPSKQMILARKIRTGDGTENLMIRRSTKQDWIVGGFITTFQLLISLVLRFIILTILEHRNKH